MPKKKNKTISDSEAAKEVSQVSKKRGSEIDEIFAGKKRKKVEEAAKNPTGESKAKKKRLKARNGFDGFGESESKTRKRTEEGLNVYTEEELGMSRSDAGGTPLCPFDCSCCF